MSSRSFSGKLDKDFITIFFMQGAKKDKAVEVRRLPLLLGIVFFLFLVISFRVWQEMQVYKLGYEINQLRHEYNQVLDEQRALISRRNSLASLERVELIAQTELGLTAPNSEQLIFLSEPDMDSKKMKFKFLDWVTGLISLKEG